jgi:thiol-disulfide isomerase/thioredoxin
MQVKKIEFAELEKQVSPKLSFRDVLAPETGKAYVVVITRDGCPACHRHKPKFMKLANTLSRKFADAVVFVEVHVKKPAGSDAESLRSKSVFGHYFYPTDLVLLRTRDRGAIEFFRAVSPRMDELRKNVENAVATAVALAKENP